MPAHVHLTAILPGTVLNAADVLGNGDVPGPHLAASAGAAGA